MKRAFILPAKLHSPGSVLFEWQPKVAAFLATVGVNNVVHLLDRQGELVDNLNLAGTCTGLAWTPDGALLAVIQEGSGTITCWDATAKCITPDVETSMKGLVFLKWNLSGDTLAIGTSKGNLLLYNRRTSKKVPILGKHAKAITTGAWNVEGILACGSEDRTFTLTRPAGDTLFQKDLKSEPAQIQFSSMRLPKTASRQPVVSMIVGGKHLAIFSVQSPEKPLELEFQPNYGQIVSYQWCGDGTLLVGFTSGYFTLVSTEPREIGQELYQTRNHKNGLQDMAVSTAMSKVATCGDSSIRVHELTDLKDIYSMLTVDDEKGMIEKLRWSDDGQFLTAGCRSGNIYTFLSRLPSLGCSYGSFVVLLTSLTEVTVLDMSKHVVDKQQKKGSQVSLTGSLRSLSGPEARSGSVVLGKIPVGVEPSVIGLGPNIVGVVMNKHAWFYTCNRELCVNGGKDQQLPSQWGLLRQMEYTGSVRCISLNRYLAAALLDDGTLQVHSLLDPNSSQAGTASDTLPSVTKLFPESNTPGVGKSPIVLTCGMLTPDFLIYGTNSGLIHFYTTEDWAMVHEFTHSAPIRALHSEPSGGPMVLMLDGHNNGFICNPVDDSVLPVLGLSGKTLGFAWNAGNTKKSRARLFIAWNDASMTLFVFHQYTIKGPQCVALGTTKLPYGLKPIQLLNGMVTCQTQSSRISVIPLATYEMVNKNAGIFATLPEATAGQTLQLMYALGLVEDIWLLESEISQAQPWKMLADAALHTLDIKTATRSYRILGIAAMVISLENLEQVEDRNLLCGHLAVATSDFASAQEFFLASSEPLAALELRKDLLQWDQALNLASTLSPKQITVVALQNAQQLEFQGLYADAKAMYEKAKGNIHLFSGNQEAVKQHQLAVETGLTRMTLRTGDLTRGMRMLTETRDRSLLIDCGGILDTLKQFTEAALTYERAEEFEKAAGCWAKAKNFLRVGELLSYISNVKTLTQFAAAKEAEGKYDEALRAYEKAKDYDNAVRIYVEHLQNLDAAVNIVRKTKSRESAKYISQFLQSQKDYKTVVEFYLMADMGDEAFALAQAHDIVAEYGEMLGDDVGADALANIAVYFENKGDYFLAGKYMFKCGDYPKALKMFLRCSLEDSQALDMAIKTVGTAKNDGLTHELIDYLMGETDGSPKDANYIFKLYVSLGQYDEAARTAIIIAREEQTLGNYRAAHDLLLDNCRQLRSLGKQIPADMSRMLMLLHSYLLIKILIRAGEHLMGARMLARVSSNISKFPAHVVPILMSTVIECQRVGLKKVAFEYAALLMRPEYRNKIDEKYKRKIEAIVRRPSKEEDAEPRSPCPYCTSPVPETTLDCMECKTRLPYCIASGRHMILEEWTICPHCEFPAIISCLKSLLAKSDDRGSGPCPMCNELIDSEKLQVLKRPLDPTQPSEAPSALFEQFSNDSLGNMSDASDAAFRRDIP